MDSVIRPIRGPGIENWDMSIFKNVPFGEGEARYLQLRVEFYNVWNHTQWTFVNVTPTFDAAGNITNLAGTPGGGRFGFGALNTVRTAAGAGLYLASHGSTLPLLQIQAPPWRLPRAAFVWELTSHFVFGAALESSRRGLHRVLALKS